MTTTTYFSPTINVPHIHNAHTPQGSYIKIGELDAYRVAPLKTTRKAVILAHDMMGFDTRIEQICDIIASQGYIVVMPYLLKSEPYSFNQAYTESNLDRFKWIAKAAPEEHLRQVIDATVKHLKGEGIRHLGIIGLNWGGKAAALASHNPVFSAAVLVSVPWLSIDDFKDTQCPIAIICPRDLKDVTQMVETLKSTKPFGRKILHTRISDMVYGHIGKFADYSNQRVVELTTEILRIAITFFKENIGIRNY